MRLKVLRFAVKGALSLISLGAVAVAQAGDVSVSVNVNTPGVYGQITLGELPAPELLMPRAVVAIPTRIVVSGPPPEPLYLHVPPGHERHWERHCHEYNACGRPVYFVSHRWYQEVYVPRHELRHEERHEHRDHDHDHDHDHDRGHGHEHEHGDDRD
jgi:hypothetical protein